MKKVIFKVLILGIVVFAVYNLISLFTSKETSVIAELETMEKSYKLEGMIIRDEKLITFDSKSGGGILDVSVSENEMVRRGKHVATYFDSNIDEETKKELARINEKISELSHTTDEAMAESMSQKEIGEEIDAKISEIAYESSSRNPSVVSSLKNDINSLLESKNSEDTKEITVAQKLEQLNNEKMNIEKRYDGLKYEITAPQHGVFSTKIDGFEDEATPEFALGITVSDYETAKGKNITANDLRKKGALCKIVDNSMWYVSVVADEATAKSFSVDENVTIRFDGETAEAKGRIEYISPGQSGKYMITISSSSYCNYAMDSRFTALTVVKESNTGLKVPLDAINVKDGKSGVYVKTENTVKYKVIDIITKDDNYAIVRFDNTKANSLLLYDEIIVKR